MAANPLLEHYRVPVAECASDDGSTLWQRRSEPLGRGAYGDVWLEENASEGKLRAVKTVRNPTSEQSQINAEVYALVNLSQRRYRPFFGEFMGFYEDDSSVSFFMEYFEKQDLRKHLPGGSELPESQAKTIIRQVLNGVRAMHEQNFTHRDLKPENIFVVAKDPWRVKIGDFGVAKKIVDGRAQLQTRVGTEQYMAPEIFCFIGDEDPSSLGRYSNSVDIWSCGVILFELLTGERPFPTHAKLKAYCDGRYKFPDSSLDLSGVSAEGTSLVRSMLHAQPADRPSAVEALMTPWFASSPEFREHTPRVAAPKSPSLRTKSSPRLMSPASSRIPSLSSGPPPARPLPAPPAQKFPSRTSSSGFRDEGYHTSSDRDFQEMVEFFPPAISEIPEKRRLHNPAQPNIQEWRTNVQAPLKQESPLSSRLSPRLSPPMRPPRPDDPVSLPLRQPLSVHASSPRSSPRFDQPNRLTPIDATVAGLGIPNVGGSAGSQVSADPYSVAQHRNAFQAAEVSQASTPKQKDETPDEDQLGPLSSTVTSDLPPARLYRASSRAESSLSFQSFTSSIAEVRESVSQKIRDGQWKVGDVIILLQVSKWDLLRISAHSIKTASPLVFTKNLHKDYINELPKLIFDALKPWFAETLGPKGTAKALAKDENTYQQRIRDDLLPSVDVSASDPEYYRLQLPKSLEVLEISKNIDGGGLRIPLSIVKKVIREHWRLYIEEYINGFLYNNRATGGRDVRAVVFDEPAQDYMLHEQFYRERLEKKLWKGIEYCNFEGFRKLAERTEKIKDEVKKPSKFSRWKLK